MRRYKPKDSYLLFVPKAHKLNTTAEGNKQGSAGHPSEIAAEAEARVKEARGLAALLEAAAAARGGELGALSASHGRAAEGQERTG